MLKVVDADAPNAHERTTRFLHGGPPEASHWQVLEEQRPDAAGNWSTAASFTFGVGIDEAIHVWKAPGTAGGGASGADYYLFQDHLGSTTSVLRFGTAGGQYSTEIIERYRYGDSGSVAVPHFSPCYSSSVRFTKMQGLGNDYLFLDAFAEPGIAARRDLHDLARALCDRHRGVGADGVIILSHHPDPAADVRMRILNADGIDGGVCGNGARCAAKFVIDRGYVVPAREKPITIDAGPRTLKAVVHTNPRGLVDAATIDMGKPIFDLDRIPVDRAQVREAAPADDAKPALYKVDHRTACFVSVGNPHMVVFIEEPVDLVNLADEGPKFERHPAFPQRINYHVVNIKARGHVVMRPWERGTGMTQACATGACAVAAAGISLGFLDRKVRVEMPGGGLGVRWDDQSGDLFMTGEAVEVFTGEWNA